MKETSFSAQALKFTRLRLQSSKLVFIILLIEKLAMERSDDAKDEARLSRPMKFVCSMDEPVKSVCFILEPEKTEYLIWLSKKVQL